MRNTKLTLTAALLAAPAAVLGAGTLSASPAHAAGARNGVCDSGEFCLYYNSGQGGAVSDFTSSIGDYGATQPGCYEFKGRGKGSGTCVKNHAASVWNRTSHSATVYYNSNYGGSAQTIPANSKANLNSKLKNQNASHTIGSKPTGGGVPGIDVSHYNSSVNWKAQYSSGVRFAYAKASEGTSWTDPTFTKYYAGARKAGMIRGAYHFANPSGASGKAQADYFIKHGGGWKNDGYTLPGGLDLEDSSGSGACYKISKSAMVGWIKSFVAEYKAKEGRTPVIYTARSWWQTCTDNSTAFHSSPLWFAHPNTVGALPGGWSKQTIWQYGERNRMDLDRYNGTLAQLKSFAKTK